MDSLSRAQQAPYLNKIITHGYEENSDTSNFVPTTIRDILTKTEEDDTGSYSEFKSDLVIEDRYSSAPSYYMSNVHKYLCRLDIDDEYFEKIYKEHFLQSIQAVNFCRYLKPPDPLELNKKRVFLPKRESHKRKIHYMSKD